MSSMSVNRQTAIAPVSGAAATTAQIFPALQNALAPAILLISGGGAYEQKKLVVRASGKVVTGAVCNITAQLLAIVGPVPAANPLTPASYTVIAASTARAVNTTSCPWAIEATLYFDSTSGKLHGFVDAVVNNNIDNHIALSNVLTGLSGAAGSAEPVITIVASLTFSATNAANVGNCAEMVLDA